MKAKQLFTFVLTALTFFIYGQNGTWCRRDVNGKKDGKWIVWLDKDWKLAKDSTTAVYFRYNYFDHGHNCNPMGAGGGKGDHLEVKEKNNIKRNNAKMLDGEYKWYNSKGQLIFEHVLDNGWYVSYKEYYPSGKLRSYFDYTKHVTDQPYSWYLFTYNKKGELTFEGWSAKDDKGNYSPSRGIDD